jgi:hypothetical protein
MVRKTHMDAFSEILTTVKLKGAMFFRAEFSSPWGISSPASSELAPALAPGAPHLVIYHLVTEGKAWARTQNEIGDRLTNGFPNDSLTRLDYAGNTNSHGGYNC